MEYRDVVNRINNNKQNYDIQKTKENFKEFVLVAKKIKEDSKCENSEELELILKNRINKYTNKLLEPNMSAIFMDKTVDYIINNKKIIKEIIDKRDSKEIKDLSLEDAVRYTQNMERNSKIIIGSLVNRIYKEKRRMDIFRKRNIKGLEDIELNDDDEFKEFLEEVIYNILAEKENKIIKNKIEKKSKQRLSNAVKLLDDINVLKINNDINNQRLEKLNLEFLKFDYENKVRNKKDIAIKDLENEEFLNRFDIKEINALNAFYVNRLVKTLDEYNSNFYFGRKLDIYNKIINNEELDIELSDEEIKYMILQKEFLKSSSQDIISEIAKKYEEKDSKDLKEFRITKDRIEETNSYKEAVTQYKSQYEKLYNKIYLPKYKNDYENDLIITSFLDVDMYNLYKIKDMSAQALMVSLIDSDENVNWGYIPEKDEKGKNTIQKGNKYILIGFDLKGYNMPIKLHFERDTIEKFLDGYTNSTAIPIYEGNEDVGINDKFLTTQVLMKLSKQQRAGIKSALKNMSSDDERYKYISHLNWMMFPNRYPEHLKKDGIRKSKIKIDIRTGNEYIEEKDIER